MPTLQYIQVEGARDVQGRFAKATDELLRARREEMADLGRRMVTVLRQEAPVRTGYLRSHIRWRMASAGERTVLRVSSDAPYTKYVLYGRGPVVAKNALALRFVINGQVLFRKRVGPAKANPFHRRAAVRLGTEPIRVAYRVGRRVVNAYSQM